MIPLSLRSCAHSRFNILGVGFWLALLWLQLTILGSWNKDVHGVVVAEIRHLTRNLTRCCHTRDKTRRKILPGMVGLDRRRVVNRRSALHVVGGAATQSCNIHIGI